MKAVRLHKVNDLRCETLKIPELKGDEILMKIGACGICGSDIPRVFETGAHVMPLTLGHEFAGTIVNAAKEEDFELIGKRAAVFPLIPCMECDNCNGGHFAQCNNYNYLGSRCDGGFAEYCIIPSKWQLVFSGREDTPFEDLCMVEPATVAQHAIRKSGVRGGETVVITGAGPIGMIAARWAKIFGAKEIILTEVNSEKTEFAKSRGFTVCNSKEEDVADVVMKKTDGRGADIVIEGTGSASGVNLGIRLLKTFGKMVLMGNPHSDTTIEQSIHSLILRKEIAVTGIWNSVYSDSPVNEWKYTVEMLDKGKLTTGDLITHASSLCGLPDLFDGIYSGDVTVCKAIYSAKCV